MYNGKNTVAQQLITYNLEEACDINKADLKRYINIRFDLIYKGDRPEITKRLIARTMTYLEGYAARLKEEMIPPVSVGDVKSLLYFEGFGYILKKIESR